MAGHVELRSGTRQEFRSSQRFESLDDFRYQLNSRKNFKC